MGRLERRLKRFLLQVLWEMITLPFVAVYQLLRWTFRTIAGKRTNADGYVVQKSRTGSDQFEHRAIAEEYLGRRLQRCEVVHHINGRRSDNRPSNLCVMSREAHIRYHCWYDWVRGNHGKPPKKSTQLKKLREYFHGQILTDAPRKNSRVG